MRVNTQYSIDLLRKLASTLYIFIKKKYPVVISSIVAQFIEYVPSINSFSFL